MSPGRQLWGGWSFFSENKTPEEPFSFYPIIISSTLLAFLASEAHLHHVGKFLQHTQQFWQSTPSLNNYLIWSLQNYFNKIFLGLVLFGERLVQGDLHVASEYHSIRTPKPKFYFQELCTPDSTRTKKPFNVGLTIYAFNLVESLQNQKCMSLAVLINSLGFHTRETDYKSLNLLHKSY